MGAKKRPAAAQAEDVQHDGAATKGRKKVARMLRPKPEAQDAEAEPEATCAACIGGSACAGEAEAEEAPASEQEASAVLLPWDFKDDAPDKDFKDDAPDDSDDDLTQQMLKLMLSQLPRTAAQARAST